MTSRVSTQHSQFLFGTVQEFPYGTLRLPIENDDGVVAIEIGPALKPAVAAFLRAAFDIWGQSMFPDLPGFAAAFSASAQEDRYRW